MIRRREKKHLWKLRREISAVLKDLTHKLGYFVSKRSANSFFIKYGKEKLAIVKVKVGYEAVSVIITASIKNRYFARTFTTGLFFTKPVKFWFKHVMEEIQMLGIVSGVMLS